MAYYSNLCKHPYAAILLYLQHNIEIDYIRIAPLAEPV